jgi:hypothetical protein
MKWSNLNLSVQFTPTLRLLCYMHLKGRKVVSAEIRAVNAHAQSVRIVHSRGVHKANDTEFPRAVLMRWRTIVNVMGQQLCAKIEREPARLTRSDDPYCRKRLAL